ncbi:MAG: hypothetical protein IJU81_01280 [Bacteroidales bacterium]|nr:hypothetical protein [Bacteroidales bacterium]
MRLFVFAIGGTGSRVLTSLIMMLAAGARPKDNNGRSINNLSIVPIIIDPHETNDALTKVEELLRRYRTMHRRIHGDNPNNEGYFGVKIETLQEVEPQRVNNDTFFFKMTKVSESAFSKFIDIETMELTNKLFAKMLFSQDELNTKMEEGFYGSPNIGCIALNEFRKSPDFNAFRAAYSEGDRIFFIGSIFGGTGASGLPLFISSIRELVNLDNGDGAADGRVNCAEAPIGALIVMPYFSIANNNGGAAGGTQIRDSEFIVKTKSALRYYHSNLNRYINRTYYISDPKGTAGFTYDPGGEGQRENKAHIVEFAGALAMFDFLAINDDGLNVNNPDGGERITAVAPLYKSYGLNTDDAYIHFAGLSRQTNRVILNAMMGFYMLRQFMKNHMGDMLTKPFANQYDKNLTEALYREDEITGIFNMFDEWISQMKAHGNGANNLQLYGDYSAQDKDFSNLFFGSPETKTSRLLGLKGSVKINDVVKALNEAAEIIGNMDSPNNGEVAYARWYNVAYRAMNNIIDNKFDITTLIQ